MSRLQDVILRDTRANQPAATTVPIGSIYFVTDESVTERSSGTAWEDMSDGGDTTGNVAGPASAVDDRIVTFDGTTGALVQDGGQTIAEVITAGAVAAAAVILPVDLAADVTGNLPVGNLGSGTGASGTTFWRGDGAWSVPAGAGDVVGPAASVDGEVALYDSTTGKLLKRATGTGILRATSGVYGTPGNVVESEITLADNTTNNVSPTKHGFAPKLPNDATKYLDGTGAYTVPAGGGGGGGLTLLESHTASASATLDFTAFISSTYDEYQISLVNVVPATNTTDLLLRVSIDGGATYDTSTNYLWGIQYVNNVGTVGSLNSSAGQAHFVLFTALANTLEGLSGRVSLFHPGATARHSVAWDVLAAQGTHYYSARGGGSWIATTAINAVRFLYSSGNIASGTIRVYGVKK